MLCNIAQNRTTTAIIKNKDIEKTLIYRYDLALLIFIKIHSIQKRFKMT